MSLRSISAINQVIRRHHCPWLRVFNSDLKALKVNLAQSTFAYYGIYAITVSLLVIGCKVFDGCTNTLGLYAIDHCSGYFPGYKRIFRVIFEIAATQWVTVNIYTRAQ